MRRIIFPFAAALGLMLAGCSNGEDGGNGGQEIALSAGADTQQEVYADNTEGSSGVSFVTAGAWTSSITETGTRATTPDWISIDPASGDKAGSYTINIILDANFSGATRSATISIMCNGQSISIGITQASTTQEGEVPSDHVTGISMNKTSLTLEKYDVETLAATIYPSYAANKTITWSSDDTYVATVDQTGKVKALSTGTAKIKVITEDGAKTAICDVTVIKPLTNGTGTVVATDETFGAESVTYNITYGQQSISDYAEGVKQVYVCFDGERIGEGSHGSGFGVYMYIPSASDRLEPGTYTYSATPAVGTFRMYALINKQDAIGGTVTVALSGDTYTLTFDVDTEYSFDYPNKITGSYTGKLRLVELPY